MFAKFSSPLACVGGAKTMLAATLLAAGLSTSAVAKDKYAFTAVAQFSESLVNSGDPKCQPDPGKTMLGEISGVGLATAVGSFTVKSTDCLRSTNPDAFTPPFAFSSTSFLLQAANGDQIVVAYSGTAEPTPSGLFALTGTFKFVSGTGQFEKVKGGGTLSGVENIGINPAQGFVTLNGEISY